MKKLHLNGWQRLWVCISGISIIVFGIISPWLYVAQSYNGRKSDYRYETYKEVLSNKCNDYINKDLSKLIEPRYSLTENTCYHIYNTRRFSEYKGPYNAQIYIDEENNKKTNEIIIGIIFCSLCVIIILIILYLLGWMFAWVRRGFANSNM